MYSHLLGRKRGKLYIEAALTFGVEQELDQGHNDPS